MGFKSRVFSIFKYSPKFNVLMTSVIQYGCIIHCFKEHIAELIICAGPSMEPTLSSNDIVIAEHITSHFDYGDIVICKCPSKPRKYICKRVTALPGDKIKSLDTVEYVPAGHVWLEGDNLENSCDSRDFGPVPQGLIRGRVICKVWPPNDVTMLTVKSHT